MSGRGQLRVHFVGILVLIGVLAYPTVPAMPAEAPLSLAKIDPVLTSEVALEGVAPAILAWDRTQADHAQVASYLRQNNVDAHLLSGLSVAFACAGSSADLSMLAAAPGAVSVWGDRALEPALDESVRTAFNGDPNTIWQNQGYTGKGVAIGVVDTGIDATHPDLQSGTRTKLNVRVLTSKHDVTGPYADPCGISDTYTEQLSDSELTSGHGTHLASVAAGDGTVSGGRYKGVAPGADLVGVGVTESTTLQTSVCASEQGCAPEQETYLSLSGAIAGMNYILATGLEGCYAPYCPELVPVRAKVILAGWVQDGLLDPWHPMAWIVRDLGWYGINVVFPVGNEGPAASDCSAAATCNFNAYAAAQGAIGVAATPKLSDATLESYSSRGDPIVRQARGEPVRYAPTLSAPGTGVVAARRPGTAPFAQLPNSNLGGKPHSDIGIDRRYVPMSGTSVSAAHVAGAIALMQEAAVKANGCYLAAERVINILRATADPMPGFQAHEVGAGALDVRGAVSAARSGGPSSSDPWMCPGLGNR
jgi:serine protease AprX